MRTDLGRLQGRHLGVPTGQQVGLQSQDSEVTHSRTENINAPAGSLVWNRSLNAGQHLAD